MSEDIKVGAVVELSAYQAGMRELVSTTQESMEAVNASLASVSGGMATLGALLGASVFTEFLDHMKEQVLETNHLSEATGISVVKITELKDAMQEAGVSTDRLPMQLTKLSRAMNDAANGVAKQQQAFADLGIATTGWSKKMPDVMDVLQQLGSHLQHSSNNTRDLADMSAIFGRGVVGLTAFLKAHGDTLDEVTRRYLEHGLEVAKAADSARQLQAAEAQVKAQIETGMLPAFSLMVDAIAGLNIMVQVAIYTWKELSNIAQTASTKMMIGIEGIGRNMRDLITGNLKDLPDNVKNTYDKMNAETARFTVETVTNFTTMQDRIDKILQDREHPPSIPEGDTDSMSVNVANATKIFKQGLEDQLTALKQNHLVSIQEELHFWQSKLQAAAAYPEVYREIQKRIGEIDQTVFKERDAAQKKFEQSVNESNQRATSEHLREIEKQLQDEIKANNEKLKAADINLEAQKAHEEAIGRLKRQTLDTERALGVISEADYEKQLQKEIAATYQAARLELQAKLATARGNLAEEAKINAELRKLDDKYRLDTEKADQQSLLRRAQRFQQYFQQISASITGELNQWIFGSQSASKAFQSMYASMISSLIGWVEQMALKRVEEWITDKIFNIKKVGSAGAAAAGIAGAAGFASVMMALPFPENVATAPEVAAASAAAAGAFATGGAAGAAAFELGGIVPMTGMALVHQGEKIIPASMSGTGAGLGGPNIVIHMGVSSLDKGTIRAAAHDIHTEVQRLLKNKAKR